MPHANTENEVITIFRDSPRLVVAQIESIGERKRIGKVNSGWAILKTELKRITSQDEVRVTDAGERSKATGRAEQWIRSAGLHFDREEEIIEELFGDNGRLKRWREDEKLRAKMLALWNEIRPEGERIESDAEARANRWRALPAARAAKSEPQKVTAEPAF